MEFYDVFERMLIPMQRHGRVSYRALKRRFDVDDTYLDDMKFETIQVQRLATDQDGEMLVWTGSLATPEANRHLADEESPFHALLPDVISLLQRERRATYCRLTYVFGIDDALMAEIRKELAFTRLAMDEDGEGLVWTDGTSPGHNLPVNVPSLTTTVDHTAIVSSPAASILPTSTITKAVAHSQGPIAPREDVSANAPPYEPSLALASTYSVPEGERRRVTVVFSDLSGYTTMGEMLDPEEVEGIASRTKAKAAQIVEAYGGIVNQFVSDEVLALFGIPIFQEDAAVRTAIDLHGLALGMSHEVEDRIGRPLRLHTGINTDLIVTNVKDYRDGVFGFTGDVANMGFQPQSTSCGIRHDGDNPRSSKMRPSLMMYTLF